MNDILQRLSDKEQIRDVMVRYARGVDRRDWELVRSSTTSASRCVCWLIA